MASSNLDVGICWDETCRFSVPTEGTSETIKTFFALNHLLSCHQSLSLLHLNHRYAKLKWKETMHLSDYPSSFSYKTFIGLIIRTTCHSHHCPSPTENEARASTSSHVIVKGIRNMSQSQWPRGLRRGSAAARLLRLRVWIPPGVWMFLVSVVWCQVEDSTPSRSLVQRSPVECGVSEFDSEASIMRTPWPTRACCAMENNRTCELHPARRFIWIPNAGIT